MRTCVVLVLLTTMGALAQAAEPRASATPDPALVDAIVRKLESDGTLDRAVERAITRVIQRQEEARRSSEVQQKAQAQERAKAARKVNSGRDHIRGEASAEVSLIEYSDFECSFCKRYHGTPASLGIAGTPTTLIRNNRTGATEMIVGAQPPEALIAAVERVLAAAR